MPLIHVYAYKCNMIILKQLLIYNCIPKEYLKRKYIFLLSQRFYLNDNNKYLLFNNCSFYLYVFILSFTATIVADCVVLSSDFKIAVDCLSYSYLYVIGEVVLIAGRPPVFVSLELIR